MFDPIHIGKIYADYVKVIHPVKSKRTCWPFKALVTIQGHLHALFLKPNLSENRDQIVVDRLKHIADLQPMHTFGLLLNFSYIDGVRKVGDWMEYFAMALNEKEVHDQNSLPFLKLPCSREEKIELCKIVIFRYMLGLSNTSLEHIIIRKGRLMSISETKISSACPSNAFLESLSFIESECWDIARKLVSQGFDLDKMRGAILQTRSPERDIFKKSSKGPLSIPSKRIAEIVEDRLMQIKECTPKDFPDIMRSNE
jgi:hypothetical protein